jgi:hypothetical protein
MTIWSGVADSRIYYIEICVQCRQILVTINITSVWLLSQKIMSYKMLSRRWDNLLPPETLMSCELGLVTDWLTDWHGCEVNNMEGLWWLLSWSAARPPKKPISLLPIVAGTIIALVLGILAVFIWRSCLHKKKSLRFPDSTQELDGKYILQKWSF